MPTIERQLVPTMQFASRVRGGSEPNPADVTRAKLTAAAAQWRAAFGDNWRMVWHMPAGGWNEPDDPDGTPDLMSGSQWLPLPDDVKQFARLEVQQILGPNVKWGIYSGVVGESPYVTDVLGESSDEQRAGAVLTYPDHTPTLLATVDPWRNCGATLWYFDHGNVNDFVREHILMQCNVLAHLGMEAGIETPKMRPPYDSIHTPAGYAPVPLTANNKLFENYYGDDASEWPDAPGGCAATIIAHRAPQWQPGSAEERAKLLKLLTLGWCVGANTDPRRLESLRWALDMYTDSL